MDGFKYTEVNLLVDIHYCFKKKRKQFFLFSDRKVNIFNTF